MMNVEPADFKVRPLRKPLGGSTRKANPSPSSQWKPRILDTARRSGLSPSHVSKIFSGQRRPSVAALEKLAAACRMTTDELLRRLPAHRSKVA